jgi:transporter family protein
MSLGFVFAVLASLAFGTLPIFHKLASSWVHSIFGAFIVSLAAVLSASMFLLFRMKSITLFTHSKGILFAALAGVCAFLFDVFALRSYSSGLPVSIGGPLIVGGSIVVTTMLGFLLGESLVLMKVVGIALVIAGSCILASLNTNY